MRLSPVGRSGPHEASKPGHVHISDLAADAALRARRAQEWGASTGRPIPPAYRPRKPLRPVARLSAEQRIERYTGASAEKPPADKASVQASVQRPYVQLSAAQCRRIAHKAGMSAAQRMQLRSAQRAEQRDVST